MPMTVVVTRDVPPRFRGFLGSCMLEIAPGVYTAPGLSVAIRVRIQAVLEEWWNAERQGSIVITWQEPKAAAGQAFSILGEPVKELADFDGLWIARSDLTSAALAKLLENRE